MQKRAFRYRTKKEDEAAGVVRNKIPIEKLSIAKGKTDCSRLICGVRRIDKKALINKKFEDANKKRIELEGEASTPETKTFTSLNSSDLSNSSPKFKISLPNLYGIGAGSESLDGTTVTEKSPSVS